MSVSHLIKEPGFFAKFRIRSEDAVAIYAEDDAMADFIVHGDIVIFDLSKTAPRSGKIFAFDQGGRTRIRQLWVHGDGSWLLESRNADKQLYPDLHVPPGDTATAFIVGEFVYRQGG